MSDQRHTLLADRNVRLEGARTVVVDIQKCNSTPRDGNLLGTNTDTYNSNPASQRNPPEVSLQTVQKIIGQSDVSLQDQNPLAEIINTPEYSHLGIVASNYLPQTAIQKPQNDIGAFGTTRLLTKGQRLPLGVPLGDLSTWGVLP